MFVNSLTRRYTHCLNSPYPYNLDSIAFMRDRVSYLSSVHDYTYLIDLIYFFAGEYPEHDCSEVKCPVCFKRAYLLVEVSEISEFFNKPLNY